MAVDAVAADKQVSMLDTTVDEGAGVMMKAVDTTAVELVS